jgi:PAS domain S-box-containing protein
MLFYSQLQPIDTVRNLLNNLDLKKDDEALQQLFIRSPIGEAILNRDGNLTTINRAHTDLLGYTAHEIMGKPYFAFFLKEDQEMFRAVLQRMIEGKLGSHSTLARYLLQNVKSTYI